MVTRITLAVFTFLFLSGQAFANTELYGYWPVGGGNITLAPIGDPVAAAGIEFVAEPGILTKGTSPAPFAFFIPNDAAPGNVTLAILGTSITIDGPVEFDVAVPASAVRGDVAFTFGRGLVDAYSSPPLIGPCGAGENCLAILFPTADTCDLNEDGLCNSSDIDFLSSAIQSGDDAAILDVNQDGVVSAEDRVFWIESINGTLAGDADLNGSVQFADFLALSDSFGEAGGWAQGDFDGDGLVEFPDFLVLSQNFGFSSSDIVAVPEPTSSCFTMCGLLICAAYLRRRSARMGE